MTALAVMTLCDSRGVLLSITAGKLRFRAAASAIDAELKSLLVAHKTELLRLLDSRPALPTEPWDRSVALALQIEADAAVERSGVSGHDPQIQAAATACVDAHLAHDLAGVRAACQTLMARVLELANERIPC